MKVYPYSAVSLLAAIFWISISLLFAACQKDDQEPPPISDPPQETEPCEPIPPWTGLGLRPTIGDSLDVSSPLVNPLNSNEVIFQIRQNKKVYKINLATGEKDIILEEGEGYIWPDWGTNGWLLFTRMQNLYKVKTNGDSLTQITFNGVGWRGNWAPSEGKYTYVTSSPETNLMRVIADKHDAVIDTLPVVINSNIDWFSDSVIYWGRGSYILGEDSLTLHFPPGPSGAVAGISSTESIHLRQGLQKLNRETGQITELHPPYPSCRSYLGIHYSPQKQKLLSTEMYRELMPDGIHEYLKFSMVWLNLDGTVHETIDIAPFFSE